MVLFSHPTGNTFSRAALIALHEAGILREFHTTLATYPGNVWDRLGGEFARRSFDERLRSKTVQHPARELGRLISNRFHVDLLVGHEKGVFCVDAVYRSLDRVTAKRLTDDPDAFSGVYAFEDGALETFRTARKLGLRCFYDLPIAYWETSQKLLREEAERLPAWEPTLGGTRDSQEKLARKTEEFELADAVICPSSFVADSLPSGAMGKTVVTAPFGTPTLAKRHLRPQTDRPLRVLFAGSMSQRKGLGDLMAAMHLVDRRNVELVVMGSPMAEMEFYRGKLADFTYEPGRSHDKVLELMHSCDVFCLPSIIEGRALVMQEAMSQGLPLIITPNTGGADLVLEGKTGFLIPIRSPEAIAEKIAWFVDNRNSIPEMGRAAQTHAAAYTWNAYGSKIVETVVELTGSKIDHA